MHVTEEPTRTDGTRVQDLCRQLVQLVSRSRQQRRAIDRLLAELNALRRRVERRARVVSGGEDPRGATSVPATLGPR